METRARRLLFFDSEIVRCIAGGQVQIEESLRELDRGLELLQGRFSRRSVFPDIRKFLVIGEDPLGALRIRVRFFCALSGIRLVEHLDDLVDALNNRKLFRAAHSCRAIIELAASVLYWEAKLRMALSRGVRRGEGFVELDNFLDLMLSGGRFQWTRWLQAEEERNSLIDEYSRGDEPKSANEQINVCTMIDKTDRILADLEVLRAGSVRAMYAMTSDFCHPNIGANMLSATRTDDSETFAVEPKATDDQLRWFFRNAVAPIIERLGKAASSTLEDLEVMVENCEIDSDGYLKLP